MTAAFTICSNNYLAQASILAESFKKYNPDCYFAIVLIDEFSEELNYNAIVVDEIVLVSSISQYDLTYLFDKYDIIELSTAIKPFMFKYFIDNLSDINFIYYLDPDIKIFADIKNLDRQLAVSSVLITPHITSPIPLDGKSPQEPLFLNHGIYNLGFLGVNANHPDSIKMLDWWGERTYNIGYSDISNGLFVDQLWINFAPLFFADVKILYEKGCNMGPWNLHERKIKNIENEKSVFLDNGELLIFYHFSSYDYRKPELISKHYNRYSLEDEVLLKQLYEQYQLDLIRLGVEKYASIAYIHGKKKIPNPTPVLNWKQKIKAKLKGILFNPGQIKV